MADYLSPFFSICIIMLSCATICCYPDYEWDDLKEGNDEAGALIHIESVLGRVANLPCDISPVKDYHRVYMVLWFKENAGKPIYSFDVRGRSFAKALHWSDRNAFGPRANFVTTMSPASLQLENVQLNDGGVYRCRVDFQSAPTRNFQINLTVIVPPHQLIIYDSSGRELTSIVGPLTEGSSMLLICEVRGGKPVPSVSWYMENTLLQSHSVSSPDNVVISKIDVSSITRSYLNRTYTCQATNTNLIQPFHRTVRLELHLKPQTVRILQKPYFLIANEEHTLTCEVVGSRPVAQMTWLKAERRFTRAKTTERKNETVSFTSIVFKPKPEDDGHILKCRAENLHLPNSSLEDFFVLNVLYPPLVSLHFGNSLNPTNIKEGDDVYFECKVRSNPVQHKILWFHDGNLVTQNMSSGIIISSESLVLQSVSYQSSGVYKCQAANERGETASQPVQLRVQYVPKCRKPDLTIIGASIEEELHILCEVDADPNNVRFSWQFNNSAGESLKVSPDVYHTINKSNSELIYKPLTDLDYGTLICWADNSIGRQLEPCVFHLVPAAKPSKLHNCSFELLENSTISWLKIECVSGYDGGLQQTFHLEIYQTNSLLMNVSNDVPIFYIDITTLNVVETTLLHLLLYSTNPKGKSETVVLKGIAFENAEKRTDWIKKEMASSSNIFTILACTLTAITLFALLMTFVLVKL